MLELKSWSPMFTTGYSSSLPSLMKFSSLTHVRGHFKLSECLGISGISGHKMEGFEHPGKYLSKLKMGREY